MDKTAGKREDYQEPRLQNIFEDALDEVLLFEPRQERRLHIKLEQRGPNDIKFNDR